MRGYQENPDPIFRFYPIAVLLFPSYGSGLQNVTMKYSYKLIRSGDHVRIVVSGKITPKECKRVIKRVMSDPKRHSDSTAIIDLRAATYEYEDKAAVIEIARALEGFHAMLKNHIAIVALRSTLFYAEIFALHVRAATNAGIRVFVDMAAAEAFCMNPPKTVSPV